MIAGRFVGRVGGIAAALGVGMAIFGSTAVAVADPAGPDNRGTAVASSDAAHGPARASRGAVKSDAHTASVRARTRAVAAVAAPTVSRLPGPASNTVKEIYATTPPNPQSTTETRYGLLGQWMINKAGQVANWVDLPYCGAGSTKANCKADTPGAKTMQEPINTIFVVKAGSKYVAEVTVDFAMRAAGFGPSPFSSVGYKAVLGTNTDPQMPGGGLLGLGFLPPLPFGLGQNGLLSFTGLGAAYRDAPFLIENSHLRIFGGEPDRYGNYIFTASVSEENLDTTGGGLLPTHGFESYNDARTKLLNQLVTRSKVTGASNLGMIAMNNAIDPADPTYTTGDADGLAQVIAITSVFGSSPTRPLGQSRPYRPGRTISAD